MKLHRFNVSKVHSKWGDLILDNNVWVNDSELVNQILKVLRYKIGDQLVLFNSQTERLYKIIEIDFPRAIYLSLVTELKPKLPSRKVHLFFSLLKKDKNDWVMQKATELGISYFVPLIADRSEKTGFNIDRAQKIIKEAAEQCGRFDVPKVVEPISVSEAISIYKDVDIYVCEQGEASKIDSMDNNLGIMIGPEGGWSDQEKALFISKNLKVINIAEFTLRAETAAIIAANIFLK